MKEPVEKIDDVISHCLEIHENFNRVQNCAILLFSEYFAGLAQKLVEVNAARNSLNAMRREHAQRRQQQEAEMEMMTRMMERQCLELRRKQEEERSHYLDVMQRERHVALQQLSRQHLQLQLRQQGQREVRCRSFSLCFQTDSRATHDAQDVACKHASRC